MSKIILLSTIDKFVGQKVTLKGWLYNKRSSGKIAFLQFRDGTGTIQAVAVKDQVSKDTWKDIQDLTIESSIAITGMVKQDKRSPTGFELELTDLSIIQLAPDDYPIGKKEHGPGFLLENRHFWLRSPRQRAIQIIRSHIIQAIYDFYQKEGFIKIDTPIFTPNACEGTTTLFEVDYFGEPAFLSQSGQLYLEACLPSFNRVFDFAPVFRAEKSKTRRHLTEFWMTNAEAVFVEHQENMSIQEQLITHILNHILSNCQQELDVLNRDLTPLEKIKAPFIRLDYIQVINELKKLGSDMKEGEDLGNDDETILMNHFDQPVFVEKFPTAIKSFYMKKTEKDPNFVYCSDLLAPEGYGEVIGGSQREDDYDLLLDSIKTHKLPQKEFQWYLDQRKYGSVPHSGFGMGLERIVAWICGLHHVRETTPFPRMLNRLRP